MIIITDSSEVEETVPADSDRPLSDGNIIIDHPREGDEYVVDPVKGTVSLLLCIPYRSDNHSRLNKLRSIAAPIFQMTTT